MLEEPQYLKEITNVTFQSYTINDTMEIQTDGICLLFLSQGQASLTIHDHTVKLKQDHLYLCSSHHTITISNQANTVLDCINMQGIRLAMKYAPLKILSTEMIVLMLQLYQKTQANHDASYVTMFVKHLLMLCVQETTSLFTCDVSTHSIALAKRVHSYIQAHVTSLKSIEELAHHFHRSPYALMHLYKDVYGCTIHSTWNTLRLQKVCTLLEQSNASIKEISELCGFSSTSYLIQLFHKQYDISPLQYRKRYRRNQKDRNRT